MASNVKTIECKNCEARYKVPANIENRKIACKRCGNPIFIKSRTTTKRRATVRRYTRVKGAVKPQKVSPMLYASGVACVLLVAAIVFFLMK